MTWLYVSVVVFATGLVWYWALHGSRRRALLPTAELPDLRLAPDLVDEVRGLVRRGRGVRVAIATADDSAVVVPDRSWWLILLGLFWRSRVFFWSGGTEDGHGSEDAAASAEADARRMWWEWRAEALALDRKAWAELGTSAPAQVEIEAIDPARCSLAEADGILARVEAAAHSI